MKSKLSSSFFVTKHAIEQFVSRKHLKSEKNILSTIKKHIDEKIYKLQEKTNSGEDKWFVPSLDCILISKPEKGKNIIVTIIKSHDDIITYNTSFEKHLIDNLLKFDITNK